MRPILPFTIVIVILILLQIIRQKNLSEIVPNSPYVIAEFELKQHPSSCWYSHGHVLFKLEGCAQYEVGSLLGLIGTVTHSIDNNKPSLYLFELSDIQLLSVEKNSLSLYRRYVRIPLFTLRDHIRALLVHYLDPLEGSLLFSLFFGGISYLPSDMKDNIQLLGIQYLMAASGLQVSLLVVTAQPFLSKSGKWYFLVLVLLLITYLHLALMSVSILRAVIQKTFSSLAKQRRRQYAKSWSLLITLVVLLVCFGVATSIALQLSFFAVVGLETVQLFSKKIALLKSNAIIKHSKPKQNILNSVKRYTKDVIITSFAIQVWLLPVLLYYFGEFSALSIVSSIAILWLLPLMFTIGIPTIVGLPIASSLYGLSLVPFVWVWSLHSHLLILNTIISIISKIPIQIIAYQLPFSSAIVWQLILLVTLWVFYLLFETWFRNTQKSIHRYIR